MKKVMNFGEFLYEAQKPQKPQPTEADIDKAAQVIGKMIADKFKDFTGERSYAKMSARNNGTEWIKDALEGPLKQLAEKGITRRNVAKKAKEYAMKFIDMAYGKEDSGSKKGMAALIDVVAERLGGMIEDEGFTEKDAKEFFADGRGLQSVEEILEALGDDEELGELSDKADSEEVLKKVRAKVMSSVKFENPEDYE